MSELTEIESYDNQGEYYLDILLDKKLVNKVKNKSELSIDKREGIDQSIRQRLDRKNIVHYRIMQGEIPIAIQQTTVKFQAPLINQKQIFERLSKIKSEERNKIGFIHLDTIQILMRSTFREGIKTPVKIIVKDNRITDEQLAILGELEGDLGYTTIRFCITLQFPVPLKTAKLDNCIGVICDFKQQRLMEKGDIPLVVCYRVSYALSNSSMSITYKHKELIYTDDLFKGTSTLIKSDKIQRDFLRTHSSRFNLPNLDREMMPSTSLERPITGPVWRNYRNEEEI